MRLAGPVPIHHPSQLPWRMLVLGSCALQGHRGTRWGCPGAGRAPSSSGGLRETPRPPRRRGGLPSPSAPSLYASLSTWFPNIFSKLPPPLPLLRDRRCYCLWAQVWAQTRDRGWGSGHCLLSTAPRAPGLWPSSSSSPCPLMQQTQGQADTDQSEVKGGSLKQRPLASRQTLRICGLSRVGCHKTSKGCYFGPCSRVLL